MSTQFQDTLKDSMDKLNIIAAKKGALVKTQTPVAFLSATCYLDGDNAVVSFNAFKDDPGLLVTLLKTAMDQSPELAYLMGQTIANLNQDSYDTLSQGVFDAEQENNLISTIAFLRASKNMTNEDYFKELENMKKELAKMDMSKQEVKDYIETFDQNVSKAMKTIKENFNKD